MSDFKHSIVLFTGDDGLPLEFNVRNTNEKLQLKALIEHGGGICTQNENSVHLISPGTKVLNVDLGKKLVSSSYIYDCVKQNYLLDVNEYVFTISEAKTSDISDEDSERLLTQRQSTCKSPKKNFPAMNVDISPIKQPNASNETTPSNLTLPSSNSAVPPICNSSESFVECSQDVSTSYRVTSHVYFGNVGNPVNEKIKTLEGLRENSEDLNLSQSLVYPSKATDLLGNSIKNTLNLHSPLKPTDLLDVRNPSNLRSPSKRTDLLGDSVGNPLNLHSPSKQSNLLVGYAENPSFIHSPSKNILEASPVLPTSPRNSIKTHKRKLFSSPRKQVDISPIMRADTKKVNKNYVNQMLELPMRNPFQEVPENVLTEKELRESIEKNSEKDIGIMDVDDISPPENLLLPFTSPIKTTNCCIENVNCKTDKSKKAHNDSAIVSSSQPEDDLDNFDNMLLSKALHKPQSEDEESLSQTCTVSSSADAQVSSKPCSAEINTTPLQGANVDNLPDSPNLSFSQINEEEYMKNLEVEVQEILERPPPRTIQDKITLVKYVCCVRKFTPRTVLESLLKKSNSLEL